MRCIIHFHTSQRSSKTRQLSPAHAMWRMAEFCAWQFAKLSAEKGYLQWPVAPNAELKPYERIAVKIYCGMD